jgi:hypothetical protein
LAINVTVCIAFVPRFGAYGAALGALAGEIAILLLWIALGRWLLGNLMLKWTTALLCVGFSAALLAYRPGSLISGGALIEQFLITALCALATWMLVLRAIRTFGTFADAKA